MTELQLDIRDAFFEELHRIASIDRNLVFLTADMSAFSLERFKKDLPEQYVNVGVAEQNMVSIAAGLALTGKRVFIYAIAPFITMRCYEQIKVDLSTMRLPVTIIGMGPGITYNSDGPTHHATEDISIMRVLPGITILSLSDPVMAGKAAGISYANEGPTYIRLDKGALPRLYTIDSDFSDGVSLLREGRDALIITTGAMVHQASEVAAELSTQGVSAGVADVYRIKPLNDGLLLSYIKEAERLVTLEEHSIAGGLGSIVSELLHDNDISKPLKRLGLPDESLHRYGSRGWMHSSFGIDNASVIKNILTWEPMMRNRAK